MATTPLASLLAGMPPPTLPEANRSWDNYRFQQEQTRTNRALLEYVQRLMGQISGQNIINEIITQNFITQIFNTQLTAKGNLLTHDGTNTVELSVGTNTHVLTADSTVAKGIKWAAIPASAADILTTKGDLLTRDSNSYERQAVGTDGQVLTADSAQANGIKWATPSSGGVTFIERLVPDETIAFTEATSTVQTFTNDFDLTSTHLNTALNMFRVVIWGTLDWTNTTTATCLISMWVDKTTGGSVPLGVYDKAIPTTASADHEWKLELDIIVKSTGGSGVLEVASQFSITNGGSGTDFGNAPEKAMSVNESRTISLDTTITNNFVLKLLIDPEGGAPDYDVTAHLLGMVVYKL